MSANVNVGTFTFTVTLLLAVTKQLASYDEVTVTVYSVVVVGCTVIEDVVSLVLHWYDNVGPSCDVTDAANVACSPVQIVWEGMSANVTLGVFTVTVTVASEVAVQVRSLRVCVAVAVTVYWRPLYADVAWPTTVTFGLALAVVGPKFGPLHEYVTSPTGVPVVLAVNSMGDPLHTVTSDAVTATLGFRIVKCNVTTLSHPFAFVYVCVGAGLGVSL